MSCFCTDGKISVRINLLSFSTVLPSNSCYNNKRPTGQKQQMFNGRTVENKGKLILSVAYSSQVKNNVKLKWQGTKYSLKRDANQKTQLSDRSGCALDIPITERDWQINKSIKFPKRWANSISPWRLKTY